MFQRLFHIFAFSVRPQRTILASASSCAPQRTILASASSCAPQRTILASASSCAPQRSLRALAFSARPGPVWHMAPSARPNTRPFTVSQPRFALSQFRLPRASFLSRSFGSLALVSRPRPSIYPRPVFRARSLGASCRPPVASAMQFPVLSSFLGVFST